MLATYLLYNSAMREDTYLLGVEPASLKIKDRKGADMACE
jgi:hypothetical protein